MSGKPFGNLKIALLADDLTRSCLERECRVWNVTPLNYPLVFRLWRPDLLLVESAWNGWKNSWKYGIASYPDNPKRNNRRLARLVSDARKLKIPCVFWSKEDGIHFDRFIASASLFDYIFTVDNTCVDRYRSSIGRDVVVQPLMFAVQPAIHYPKDDGYKHREACFLGSYSQHVHERRRMNQDMLFAAACEIGLTVFDRNSNRKSANYRYPELPNMQVRPAVSHEETAQIYRDFMVSLNVNTIENSETQCSRRLVEIIGCAGLAVTTPAKSVDRYFRDYCHVVSTAEEGTALFQELKDGLRPRDLEMMRAGADYVLQNHTYVHRLETILGAIK